MLSIGARTEIPKTKGVTLSTTIRYMTGSPFTIYNSAVDVNRNGELEDPVPAGTYSGAAVDALQDVEFDGKRNGARGPDIFQADVRAGWRHRMGGSRVLEVFLDIFNITNRANFDNPVLANRDQRTPANFLVLTNLYGGERLPAAGAARNAVRVLAGRRQSNQICGREGSPEKPAGPPRPRPPRADGEGNASQDGALATRGGR